MIRQLKTSDYEAFSELRSLALATNPTSFWATEIEERPIREKRFNTTVDHPENFMLGLFIDDQLVSILGFMREEKIKLNHKGYIWGVFTHPDHRGKGHGESLMDLAIKLVFEIKGVLQINLSVAALNMAAKNLYLKMGFEIYGEEKRASKVNGDFYDELYLVKAKG